MTTKFDKLRMQVFGYGWLGLQYRPDVPQMKEAIEKLQPYTRTPTDTGKLALPSATYSVEECLAEVIVCEYWAARFAGKLRAPTDGALQFAAYWLPDQEFSHPWYAAAIAEEFGGQP